MTRYHINIHGEPAKCDAQIECRANGNNSDTEVEHFEGSLTDARSWAEQKNAQELGGSGSGNILFGSMKNTKPKTIEEAISVDISLNGKKDVKTLKQIELNDEDRKFLLDKGLSSPKMYEISASENAGDYKAEIETMKKSHPFGASVYVYSEEEYKDMRLFVSDDGSVGFALKPDGDIVSVYSTQGSKHKGSVYNSILIAVNQGGKKLDCFDTVLPQLYKRCGFEETGRDTWDDQYKPDDWNKETFKKFNNGEPDVVYFEYKEFDKNRF